MTGMTCEGADDKLNPWNICVGEKEWERKPQIENDRLLSECSVEQARGGEGEGKNK